MSFLTIRIGIGTDWKFISAGYYQTVAIKKDGSLWAWGFNAYGALGDGTVINKNIPILISCSSLGMNELQLTKKTFSIYPNPVKDFLHIENSTNQSIDKIIITDLSGKIVLNQSGNFKEVAVQHLQQGIYLLKIFIGGNSYHEKFIKE